MRRWLTVLALGLLWTQAASAQPGSEEDYAPADASWPFPLYSSHPENGGLYCGSIYPYRSDTSAKQQKAEALEVFMAKIMSKALDVHREGGKNVDASCLDEVVRHKALLTWRGLFSEHTWLDRFEPEPPPLIFRDGCPCLEVLNYLCFFDVLSPAKVGPDMGPWLMELEPAPPCEGGLYIGFFRKTNDPLRSSPCAVPSRRSATVN